MPDMIYFTVLPLLYHYSTRTPHAIALLYSYAPYSCSIPTLPLTALQLLVVLTLNSLYHKSFPTVTVSYPDAPRIQYLLYSYSALIVFPFYFLYNLVIIFNVCLGMELLTFWDLHC